MTQLYNVYAVSMKDGSRTVIAEGKTEANAEAIVNLAVMRKGVEEAYFLAEPAPIAKEST